MKFKDYIYNSFLPRIEFDRPVFFGLMARMWGMAAGPVTALLIATIFSPALQGYYYTFANLLALQVFAELGLGTVLVQFASHEWSRLHLDESGRIQGDPGALSKLASLARFAVRWYAISGMILVAGLGAGGYIFFSQTPDSSVVWVAPWFLLCLVTGINLCLIPVWSLLEGCNQVARLYSFRFFQGIIGSIAAWGAIIAGAGLWTATISSAMAIGCSVLFLRRSYRNFFGTLLSPAISGLKLSWREEILPMQWRIALSWMSGYFVFSLFTPVLFHFHGPVVAGQFGMSWSVVGALTAVASSWLAPKVPQFGMLVAQREFGELDILFRKVTIIVFAVSVVLAFACWLAIYVLSFSDFSLAQRLLPPLPFGIFLIGQVVVTFSLPFSAYLRAHKQEPMLLLSIMGALLIGISTVVLGKYFAATGMAVGYLAVQVVLLPFVVIIWQRCRKLWHEPIEMSIHG